MSEAISSADVPRDLGWRDFLELSKARIVLMVLMTTAAGFVVAAPHAFDLALLIHTLIGTAFVAAGTNALNQYLERDLDGLMARTRRRPLPSQRMTDQTALVFSLIISVFGTVYLYFVVHWIAAALALTTLVTYLGVYTPLKRRTTMCTIIGAVPGAIPPMVGWAAAAGELSFGAWFMFGVLFLWQMPHFLALAWIYRDDYENAGFAMVSVGDIGGRATSTQAVLYAMALIPMTLIGPFAGVGGLGYVAGAMAISIVFVVASLRFALERTNRNARTLFMVSNLFLVAIMSLIVVAALT